MIQIEYNELQQQVEGLDATKALELIANRFPGRAVFTTSFGVEDQVIVDIIFKNDLDIKVSTLDTGRLFEQTYQVMNSTLKKYNKKIEVYFPDKESVQSMLTEKGPYSFYHSIENRKECCNIRKVEPLGRALKDNDVWITGIRSEQSPGRTDMKKIEEDTTYDMIKFNPILDWTMDDVMNYLNKNNIPYNSLHHKGFISIGCAPCTRAVEKGEDFRSGRWWWENSSAKECGLHVHGNKV